MPPKPATTTTRQSGRIFRSTARKSILNSNSNTPMSSPPPSSTTSAATAVVPPPSTATQESRSIHPSIIKRTLKNPPHATPPASQTQPRNSQKNLVSDLENEKSDMAEIDGHENEESKKYIEPQKPGIEQFGPEKIIHVETVSVVGSGDGSKNTVNLSSVPAVRSHIQGEGSVEPVTGPGSGTDGVARSGNGKRRIVKKVVRVVKKVIKKRVPKRVLMHDSENQGLMVKTEESEVTKNLIIDNDGIEKSNSVDEVIEKPSIVNEAKEIPNIAVGITENSNLVNNDVIEKSNLVDGVTEKTCIINEVMEEANITDDMTQKLELLNSAGVIDGKGKDVSGTGSTETKTSKLNYGASAPEQTVPANDQCGVNTSVTDNIMSNDVITCAPDSMEIEKVNYIAENVVVMEEMADTVMKNQAKKDYIVENQDMYIVNKADVGLEADRAVGLEGEKSEVLVRGTNGSTFGKPESASANEGLILSGEMEALERKKGRQTEIFVGGLDGYTKEDDIRKVFEEFGIVVEVRLVMSNTGRNRGFAFVRFATAADAKNALAKYSNVEICGKQCNVAPVGGNDTIFLGNIDRNWKTEDVVTLLEKAGIEKMDKVTLKADPNNVEKNRGFAFLEFETSRDAQIAFNKLQKRNAFGENLMVKVAWAQPLIEPDEEEILKVKSVYAEYLPSSWDAENVKEYFKRFGEIENVVLAKDLPSSRRKDFAFIHYTNRDAALTCIAAVSREISEDHGSKVKIAVSLANPNPKSKPVKLTPDRTSKQPPKAKPKAIRTSIKLHEPRHQGKPASSSYDDVKVDNRPSTTDELVQILRQQASNKHIHPHPHPRTGTNARDLHFPFPGSKRPFSQVGYDPVYAEPQGFSRARVESSYPISGPSYSLRGGDVLSFPYHHPQQRPDFTLESAIGRRSYPSHFQEREQAPYYSDNIYRRY